MQHRYDAVLFDLLTALIDSWTLWNDVAGGAAAGMAWRKRYLELTYGQDGYRRYESIVADAAEQAGLERAAADRLEARWDEMLPWDDVGASLGGLRRRVRLGVVTNCSTALGRRAAARVGVAFDVVVTAEEAGAYKPDPLPYRLALARIGTAAARVLFVAGSPSDIAGANGCGMDVVWHNRIGLPRPALAPGLLAEGARLQPLLACVVKGD